MILSSPFSRQNRSHQSWTPTSSNYSPTTNQHQNSLPSNGFSQHSSAFKAGTFSGASAGLKKSAPPPSQQAPKQPIVNGFNQTNYNNINNNDNSLQQFRSHTLNRLDALKARQQRQQFKQRNLSTSLGHHNHHSTTLNNHNSLLINNKQQEQTQIYAPASIASPGEFVLYKPNNDNRFINESNHYASASCRAETPASINHHNQQPTTHKANHYATSGQARAQSITSGSYKSGRESSLSNLLSRFGGSLRRKTRLLSLNRNNSSSKKQLPASCKPTSFKSTLTGDKNKSRSSSETPTLNRTGPPPKVTSLDPEIYGPSGKKAIQAEEIYAEGLVAIDGNSLKRSIKHEIEDESLMNEGEIRTLIDDLSMKQINFKLLIKTLINWLNDELAEQRIIVKDLQDDLYDGQILSKLIEKLESIKLDLVEITQNELNQKYKLDTILKYINNKVLVNRTVKRNNNNREQIKWSVDGIHGKNLVEIIFLLIALAQHYKAPIKIPPNVIVQVLIVQKYQGQLMKRSLQIRLTLGNESDIVQHHSNGENIYSTSSNNTLMLVRPYQIEQDTNTNTKNRDVFDTLVEFAPDKLLIVKQTLAKFVNRHLNRINMNLFRNRILDVLDPEQFSDGLLLVFLISSLEDYFIPLGNLFTSAHSSHSIHNNQKLPTAVDVDVDDDLINEQIPDLNNNYNILQTAIEPNSYINTQPIHKLHNVNFALQLIEDAGIYIKQKVRAEDIVNGDLKAVLRVLYALFSRYKHL